ncbi:MAG TPA: hypothetical protein VFH87_07385, partial [Candidatus Udaeobacter sp.]|nr:hypothetical protein [Candidatus Udaeobacter sp.]
WPTLTSIIWDDEMQSYSTEEEQVVPAGTTPTSGTGFNESIKAIDKWRSKRIRTSRNPGFALVTFQYAPFKFPGLAPSPNKVDYRRASSMLTKHTIATYWVTNVGGPPSVATDEIVYDTIVLNSINGGGNLEQVDDVLHDSAFFGGGYWFGATTPSYSEYTGWQTVFGTGAWIFTAGSATVTGSGTNFTGELHVGDVVGRYWGMGPAITIISIGSATTLTLSSPMPISGSSGVYVSRDLGSRWIGTSRVVGATVSPTNIPNLWKVQTKSVVMR